MVAIATLSVVSLILFSCKNNVDQVDTTNESAWKSIGLGTKWKLVGLYNEETEHLNVFEPIDCDECYTLTLISDTVVELIYIVLPSGRCGFYYNISGDFPRDFKNLNGGGSVSGYGNALSHLFTSVKSFSVNDSELRLYMDMDVHFWHDELIAPYKKYSCLLFKKYGTFKLEKEDASGPSILPPNLKGTRWKLKNVYDKPSETYTVNEPEPIEGCDDCYTLAFDTDVTAKVRTGSAHPPYNIHYLKFLRKDESDEYGDYGRVISTLLDENGNKTNHYCPVKKG